MQTGKLVMTYRPDIAVEDKHQKNAVVTDVAIPSDSNIRKKEHKKPKEYQGLKEELEKMCRVKATVVPEVRGALWAVTLKLERWHQQMPRTTSRSSVLRKAKTLLRTLQLPGDGSYAANAPLFM